MKRLAIAAAVLVATAGLASAKPRVNHHGGYHAPKHSVAKLTLRERLHIARSKTRLLVMQRRARADGHVSKRERRQLSRASQRHRMNFARARRY